MSPGVGSRVTRASFIFSADRVDLFCSFQMAVIFAKPADAFFNDRPSESEASTFYTSSRDPLQYFLHELLLFLLQYFLPVLLATL